MKRVWKCDFCNHTDVNGDSVKSHEKGCHFNPKNKTCTTCKHQEWEGYGHDSWTICTWNANNNTFDGCGGEDWEMKNE